MVERNARCDLCGRSVKLTMLELISSTRQYLCPDCLAHEQSCGCEDEEEGYSAPTGDEKSKLGGGKAHS